MLKTWNQNQQLLMASTTQEKDGQIYALIEYEDPYVQPLIVAAVKKHIPSDRLIFISNFDDLPSKTTRVIQWLQYESINFEHLLSHPSTSLSNSYIIRKALIRKHYLSTTVANWVVKHPESVLKNHVKPSVEFEVDYAEFLDDALVEAWELHDSWQRSEQEDKKEWWILKPGMSERGQGIRLFSSEEELTTIFEGWDPESDDEEDEEDGRSDAGSTTQEADKANTKGKEDDEANGKDDGIITSQLRHFIAQPYIHPPLLLQPPSAAPEEGLRKFHIRTYVLVTGALKVYVYRDMLALFAARPYVAPSSTSFSDTDTDDALRAHLTNTCLQSTGEREGSVGLFWNLPNDLPNQPPVSSSSPEADASTPSSTPQSDRNWKDAIFEEIGKVTGEVFEAAARGMSIHFQPLPNAFEIFGLDFMVGIEEDGMLRTWLLEVNAFPDFRQTGEECKGVVEGLMEEVIRVAVAPFFNHEETAKEGGGGLVNVLDVDLGRR